MKIQIVATEMMTPDKKTTIAQGDEKTIPKTTSWMLFKNGWTASFTGNLITTVKH